MTRMTASVINTYGGVDTPAPLLIVESNEFDLRTASVDEAYGGVNQLAPVTIVDDNGND